MFTYIAIILDSLMVIISAVLSWYFIAPLDAQEVLYVILGSVSVLLFLLISSMLGVYQSYRAITDLEGLLRLSWVWLIFAVALLLGLWAFKLSEDFSRLWLGCWFVAGWLLSVLWRSFAYMLLKQLRAKGFDQKKVAIVGAGDLGKKLINRVNVEKTAGFVVVAAFDDDPNLWFGEIQTTPILPIDKMVGWLRDNHVDEVWFALPLRAEARLHELLHDLRHSTVNLRYVPNLSSLRLLNHAPREVLGMSMLDLSVSPMSELGNQGVKWLEDKLLAVLILLLISPLMMIIAVGIKLSSPGPVFYYQQRVGLNGKLFNMLKFRSMPVDVEKNGVRWGGASSKTNTWFGAFIRKTSLDELPQFINVLKGDMSIVGPRPERPMFVEQFKDEIPGYMQKHMVKAGITGWAQVHGWRGDTCLKTRIEYDLWYIEHWSLGLDIKIILLTFVRGFFHVNAR